MIVAAPCFGVRAITGGMFENMSSCVYVVLVAEAIISQQNTTNNLYRMHLTRKLVSLVSSSLQILQRKLLMSLEAT